jgi:hypothetical protein
LGGLRGKEADENTSGLLTIASKRKRETRLAYKLKDKRYIEYI